MNETIEKLWKFVRGDLSTQDFENWIYADKNPEELMGSEDYLELVSVNYKSKDTPYEAKIKVQEILSRFPRNCQCITLADADLTDMGSEREDGVFQTLDKLKAHGEPYWWLALYQCKACEQNWLVAQETRQNDVHCFKRITKNKAHEIQISNTWPNDFKTYEELLLIGKQHGCSVRFVDPMDSSMIYTIADLAKERPGISVSEIAMLLSVEKELAEDLCKKAEQQEGAQIKFY